MTEQFTHLAVLVEHAASKAKLTDFLCRVSIVWWIPDMVTLDLPHGMQIIYGADLEAFDLWDRDKRIVRMAMSIDQAAEFIVHMAMSPQEGNYERGVAS